MPRFLTLACLALLAPGLAHAATTQSGGVALSAEATNSEGQIVDQAIATLQQINAFRAQAGGSSAANSAASAANNVALTQPGDATRNDAILQNISLRRTELATQALAHQPAPQFTENTLVVNDNSVNVNAKDSPVTIGSGNVVTQTVSNSTAISTQGNATAGAAVPASTTGTSGASTGPSATSNAISVGGIAHAVASNSEVILR